jgi:hypothetical protein
MAALKTVSLEFYNEGNLRNGAAAYSANQLHDLCFSSDQGLNLKSLQEDENVTPVGHYWSLKQVKSSVS